MDTANNNPWAVDTLDTYLFYCCPGKWAVHGIVLQIHEFTNSRNSRIYDFLTFFQSVITNANQNIRL